VCVPRFFLLFLFGTLLFFVSCTHMACFKVELLTFFFFFSFFFFFVLDFLTFLFLFSFLCFVGEWLSFFFFFFWCFFIVSFFFFLEAFSFLFSQILRIVPPLVYHFGDHLLEEPPPPPTDSSTYVLRDRTTGCPGRLAVLLRHRRLLPLDRDLIAGLPFLSPIVKIPVSAHTSDPGPPKYTASYLN